MHSCRPALDPIVAIIPALNEAQAIAGVVREALELRDPSGRRVFARIIVADNGSTDDTAARAREAGAQVIREDRRGYGAACWAGMTAMGNASTVVFIDGDASTPIEQTPLLIAALAAGADLAIGVRSSGRRAGMSLAQRFGNRLATVLICVLWRVRIRDLGPFRAVRSEPLRRMNLRDRAFGWTVEMQLAAVQLGLSTVEVGVGLRPRIGTSKISGTVRGTMGAGIGIVGTILRLWWDRRIGSRGMRGDPRSRR